MICKYCGKFYFEKNKSNEKCEIEFKEIKNIINKIRMVKKEESNE